MNLPGLDDHRRLLDLVLLLFRALTGVLARFVRFSVSLPSFLFSAPRVPTCKGGGGGGCAALRKRWSIDKTRVVEALAAAAAVDLVAAGCPAGISTLD